ncbi:MAG TPA: hypothetical protein VMU06_06650 [Stellaceae bacterium]|nr:hypothetical protein [Stellaceae bacterium]
MVLRLSDIERGLLVEAVRLLERAAKGEDVREEARRFVAGLEIRSSGETDAGGRPLERVNLKRPRE